MIWHANKVQTYNNNRWAIDACITLATNTQQEIMMNFQYEKYNLAVGINKNLMVPYEDVKNKELEEFNSQF